jgi:hypothetical protein
VSINDCVLSGVNAANRVMDHMKTNNRSAK